MGGSGSVENTTNVSRRWTVPGWCAAALLLAASPAAAQPAPGAIDTTARTVAAVSVGTSVLARSGDKIGTVEHVLAGADGGAAQVLVRTGGIARVRSSLKALPAVALTPKGSDLSAPLTREELLALPDVDAPQPPPSPPTAGPEAAPPSA